MTTSSRNIHIRAHPAMSDVPEAVAGQHMHRAIAPHLGKDPWPYASALIRHSGFREALRLYCASTIQPSETAWPADKFFGQKLRYLVSFVLIGLDARWRRGEGDAPTLAVLQRIAPASARQIAALVGALKLGGYIVASQLPEDRRAQRLSPSMALLQAIGRSPLAFLKASEQLDAAAPASLTTLRLDVCEMGDWLGASYEMFSQEDVYFAPFPNIVEFTGQDCGYPVLLAVLAAHYAALANVPAPAHLSYRGLAERFRVSQQHIRNVLGNAERRGCLSVGHGGASVTVSTDFLSEFETWAAGQMAHYRLLAERVLSVARPLNSLAGSVPGD